MAAEGGGVTGPADVVIRDVILKVGVYDKVR